MDVVSQDSKLPFLQREKLVSTLYLCVSPTCYYWQYLSCKNLLGKESRNRKKDNIFVVCLCDTAELKYPNTSHNAFGHQAFLYAQAVISEQYLCDHLPRKLWAAAFIWHEPIHHPNDWATQCVPLNLSSQVSKYNWQLYKQLINT